MRENITTHLHYGDRVDVLGSRTGTVGKYLGIVLNDAGEAMIAIDVDGGTPVVYGFNEVKKIEVLNDDGQARSGVREAERAA